VHDEQTVKELQRAHKAIEQHCVLFRLRLRPGEHKRHVVVELQVTQLGIEQLKKKRHVSLVNI
jgi:hypothetical protein